MSSGSRRPIRRLLVANRGEIACRVFRTARAMGIETVAIYADGDADAPFVTEADQAVALGGTSATATYLDQDKVLAAARRTGADAIHPGYGFLSENASFASAVEAAGLVWVGPPPAAIAAMGDKLEAKKLMVEAGVPTLDSVEVTPGLDLAQAVAGIGYPVLVKAAAGGGGKGMRVVDEPTGLADAVAGAQREAESSFGDGTVFLERYLTASRHVEIQILGDTQGQLVHCFERECSIQRRHQKIIEEAPSPGIDQDTRAAMGAAAVAAARAIGYHNAGTVEFLVADTGQGEQGFWFLEVNTRLQVEHPVTEEVTGMDLVRHQLRVAAGEPLGFDQDDLQLEGHAIEARLYAEDPANGFLPATGTLSGFALAPSGPEVRLDAGVGAGSVVSVEFDPMLAKVIASGPTRQEAALRLALALERMTVSGVTTNRDFLVAALRHDRFLAGDTTTDFIDRVDLGAPDHEPPADLVTALVLHRQAGNRSRAGALAFMPSGYRNSSMPPASVTLVVGDRELIVRYRAGRGDRFEVQVTNPEAVDGDQPVDTDQPDAGAEEGRWLAAEVHHWTSDTLDATVDGVRATYTMINRGLDWHVQGPTGHLVAVERSPFPDPGGEIVAGGQLAPMPGSIRVVAVTVGDQVEAGQTLVVMEAMKMEHTVTAPEPATVGEIRCAVGDQVDNGEVLVVLEPIS